VRISLSLKNDSLGELTYIIIIIIIIIRSLIWDVTVSRTTGDSCLGASSREAGAAAELAASNKVVKYAGLSSQGEFVPIAVEYVPRPNQQRCSSVLERVGQAIGGDDRGCSSIFVFIPTDFRCGATF